MFSSLIEDFRSNVAQNHDALRGIAKRNPHTAYQKINELALFVGSRYGLNFQLHFPIPSKIIDVDAYGSENIGIVIDKSRRAFPIERERIKQKAIEILGHDTKAVDAYMYEGKEGVRVTISDGRLEILPGSLHIWCQLNERVIQYADWLMTEVYFSASD